MTKHGKAHRHARNPGKAPARAIAALAVLMVFVAVAAVFIPAKPKAKVLTFYKTPLGALIHPLFRDAASSSPSSDPPSDPASPTPIPPLAPSSPATISYPAPTYPAPTRTYPAPIRTYPAPSTPTPPDPTSPGQPTPNPTPSDLPPVKPLIQPLLGVVSDNPSAWAATTHSNPVLATRYVSMATPLDPVWLHSAMRIANGATPVVELTLSANNGSGGITLADVANGKVDNWLTDLRAEINQLGRPVIISFAPEANGTWYSWGTQLVPGGAAQPTNASAFKAAYDHVHAALGTNLVTYLWQMSAHNKGDPATADFNAYWPGAPLVNWVGFDGYYYQPGDNFNLRFGSSLAEVESWWHGPIIIAETAVSPLTKNMPNDITDLFNQVRANRLLGLIYLDLNVCQGECSLYRQDFRVEQYPAALAAFIKEASSW